MILDILILGTILQLILQLLILRIQGLCVMTSDGNLALSV